MMSRILDIWRSRGAPGKARVDHAGALGVVNPRASRLKDARDRQIGQLGDYTGSSFVTIGAVAAMLMAIAGWDRFWIANVIYLCFFLSAILGSVTKIIAYRRPFQQW
jgi:hypothetical protein